MIELIQITNDPIFARRCDEIPGMRLWVDLERLGKLERQGGLDTFISAHRLEDVGLIKSQLSRTRLMVRVNPLNDNSPAEVDSIIDQGADLIMLPMFEDVATIRAFVELVAGRRPIVPLLETAGALKTLDDWIGLRGIEEVYIGLNDLHLSLGLQFIFEPLALGLVDRIAQAARAHGLRFGFGGIARMNEGLLPGRALLGEHLRLGSGAVILSRTFHRSDSYAVFEREIEGLRQAEAELAARDPREVEQGAKATCEIISRIAASMTSATAPWT